MAESRLIHGDCLRVMKDLPGDSLDALVTDPPAGISFMNKSFDTFKGREAFINYLAPRLAECLRVCKPGAVGLVWALPRTSHWTALAVEESGWVLEEKLLHLFGTGFPKHKSKLKPAYEEWHVCRKSGPLWLGVDECRVGTKVETWPATRRYGAGDGRTCALGHGEAYTAPTGEPPPGRWPANFCLSHSPDCRQVGTRRVKGDRRGAGPGKLQGQPLEGNVYNDPIQYRGGIYTSAYGDADGTEEVEHWECADSCPVRLLDEQAGERHSYCSDQATAEAASGKEFVNKDRAVYELAKANGKAFVRGRMYADKGGPSRFFYCAKASKAERGEGNKHPTCKSTVLMEWLVKLACPPGGTVLDCFGGSGSTALACVRTGRRFVLIEAEREYHDIACKRLREECEAVR